MAQRTDSSGPMALSRRLRGGARAVPGTVTASSAFGGPNVLPRRAAQPAEIAQARVFERLLQAENAELQQLEHRMAEEGHRQPHPDDSQTAGELTQIRARIDEVDGLLQALHGRFPHSAPDGDR